MIVWLFGEVERWRKWGNLGDFGGDVSPLFPHLMRGGDKKSLQNGFKGFIHLFNYLKSIDYEWS